LKQAVVDVDRVARRLDYVGVHLRVLRPVIRHRAEGDLLTAVVVNLAQIGILDKRYERGGKFLLLGWSDLLPVVAESRLGHLGEIKGGRDDLPKLVLALGQRGGRVTQNAQRLVDG